MIDSAELVAGFPVFSRLPATELGQVCATATTVWFAARHRVSAEGEHAEGCWLTRNGRVALDVFIPGRGLVVVQTLGTGDVLGWSWLVPPYPLAFRRQRGGAHRGGQAGHRAASRPHRDRHGLRLQPGHYAVQRHATALACHQGAAARPVPESL